MRKICLCEAVFFRAEDKGDAAAAGDFPLDEWGNIWQGNEWLVGLAVLERACAHDEGAIGYGICERLCVARALEQIFGVDCGLCLAPIRLIRSDDGHAGEAEVGHGSRGRSYIEGIARRDEDDFNAIALVFGEQSG
jgi:hypothetical protein